MIDPVLRLSHDLLAALHAELQGRFVLMNVLQMFKHPEYDAQQFRDLKTMLDSIVPFSEALWKGTSIVKQAPVTQTDFDGQNATVFQMADSTRMHLVATAVRASQISPDGASRDDLAYLLGCRTWAAYAYEHLIKSYVHFGEVFKDEQMADRSRQQLLLAANGIGRVHADMQELQAGSSDLAMQQRMLVNGSNVVGVLMARAETFAAILEEFGVEPDPLPPKLATRRQELLESLGLAGPR